MLQHRNKKSHDLNSTSMVHLDAWNHGSFMPRSLHIQTTCLGGFRSLAKGAKVLYWIPSSKTMEAVKKTTESNIGSSSPICIE